MNFVEQTLCFPCHGSWLYGVLCLPEQASSRGVLIVVGGPQYRAGSHRQFVLLARSLASEGVPVMRFDYRGMGDSEGENRMYDAVDDDIHTATKYFFASLPAINELVILGVCDAASAALFYAHQNERVSGLVLVNPWIRTGEGKAKTYLRHYYTDRLFQSDLWKKILHGSFNYAAAVKSLSGFFADALFQRKKNENRIAEATEATPSLPGRMLDGFQRFKGRVLLVLSGNDLTAREFSDHVRTSRNWQKLLKSSRVTRFELTGADHTFSRREWRNRVANKAIKWLESW